jgi:hypothetical protein
MMTICGTKKMASLRVLSLQQNQLQFFKSITPKFLSSYILPGNWITIFRAIRDPRIKGNAITRTHNADKEFLNARNCCNNQNNTKNAHFMVDWSHHQTVFSPITQVV